MSTLQDRLEEVMRAMNWQHADVVRVSRQSSSVVSQWLGKGSKVIHTIGKLEAALYIERASGFSALWVAKGMLPKYAKTPAPVVTAVPPAEPATPYGDDDTLDRLAILLRRVPPERRAVVAEALAGWARAGAGDRWRDMLVAALGPSRKQQSTA